MNINQRLSTTFPARPSNDRSQQSGEHCEIGRVAVSPEVRLTHFDERIREVGRNEDERRGYQSQT